MRTQVEALLPPDLAQPAVSALTALEAQQLVADVPEALGLLFRPSLQPYLMSWFRHDPAQVLAETGVPVLLVHGGSDPQIPVEHVLWLQQARPDAKLKIVEGMDHLLSLGGDIPAGTRLVADEVAAWLQELDVRVAA